jgi:hypothetical protein
MRSFVYIDASSLGRYLRFTMNRWWYDAVERITEQKLGPGFWT